MDIDKSGPSTLYTATTDISDRTVTANAFKNGTGGVVLTMSSLIHGPKWECVVDESKRVATKIPMVVHPDRRRGLLFRAFGSNIGVNDCAISVLGRLNIEHTTELQGYREWHWARKFSTTSKGVALQLPIQMRMDKARDERQPHWVIIDEYLSISCAIGELAVNEPNISEDTSNEEPKQESESSGENASSDDDLDGAAGVDADGSSENDLDGAAAMDADGTVDQAIKSQVEGMIKDATDTTERNAAYCQTLIEELKAGEHKELVEELVRQMGGKVCKSHNANHKQLSCNVAGGRSSGSTVPLLNSF